MGWMNFTGGESARTGEGCEIDGARDDRRLRLGRAILTVEPRRAALDLPRLATKVEKGPAPPPAEDRREDGRTSGRSVESMDQRLLGGRERDGVSGKERDEWGESVLGPVVVVAVVVVEERQWCSGLHGWSASSD